MVSRLKFVIFVAALFAVLLLPALVAAQGQPLTVTMAAQNNSGQTGTTTLTQGSDGRTTVAITLAVAGPGGAEVAQPAHIHSGSCPNPGAVVYPLTNVVNGKSTTVITASLASLLAAPMAVNVHKSAAESSVYTSCGNIVAQAVQATPSAVPAATATVAATAAATTAVTSTAAPAATATPQPQVLPRTGDDTGAPMEIVLLLAALGVLGVAVALRKAGNSLG